MGPWKRSSFACIDDPASRKIYLCDDSLSIEKLEKGGKGQCPNLGSCISGRCRLLVSLPLFDLFQGDVARSFDFMRVVVKPIGEVEERGWVCQVAVHPLLEQSSDGSSSEEGCYGTITPIWAFPRCVSHLTLAEFALETPDG